MSVEMTFAKVRQAAEELVFEKGKDFLYSDTEGHKAGEGCVYVHPIYERVDCEDTPGCLVGQIMYRIGVPLSAMRRYNTDTPSGTLLHLLEEDGSITFASDKMRELIRRYLGEAQFVQDNDGTWGRALRAADIRAESWALGEAYPDYDPGCDCSQCLEVR